MYVDTYETLSLYNPIPSVFCVFFNMTFAGRKTLVGPSKRHLEKYTEDTRNEVEVLKTLKRREEQAVKSPYFAGFSSFFSSSLFFSPFVPPPNLLFHHFFRLPIFWEVLSPSSVLQHALFCDVCDGSLFIIFTYSVESCDIVSIKPNPVSHRRKTKIYRTETQEVPSRFSSKHPMSLVEMHILRYILTPVPPYL